MAIHRKLAFVTDTLSSGGAERVLSILTKLLADDYDKITIICLRKKPVFYEIDPRVEILFVDDFIDSPSWPKRLLGLRKIVVSNNYDVVIPFMVRVYTFTLTALLGVKTKIISAERNDPNAIPRYLKVVRNLLLRRSDLITVQTENIKSAFPKSLQSKIRVIYNPVLLKVNENEWCSESKQIITIGRLDPQKNQTMMFEAFSEIHAKHPDFILSVFGVGPSEQILKDKIKELNAENYIFLEGRSSEIEKHLKSSYLFVMSSNYEGFSNALIEAIFSGLPIISTKVSGAVDIIKSGENGILTDINDKQQLVDAFDTLLSDKRLAQTFSLKVKKQADHFQPQNIKAKWINAIDSI